MRPPATCMQGRLLQWAVVVMLLEAWLQQEHQHRSRAKPVGVLAVAAGISPWGTAHSRSGLRSGGVMDASGEGALR